MQTNLILLITFWCALIGITSAIVCLPNVCQLVDCIPETRESCEADGKSLFKPKGGYCGCCPLCVHLLDEGEVCVATLLHSLSVPSKVQCREGLTCNPETVKCAKPSQYY